jgi:hypothetical protein
LSRCACTRLGTATQSPPPPTRSSLSLSLSRTSALCGLCVNFHWDGVCVVHREGRVGGREEAVRGSRMAIEQQQHTPVSVPVWGKAATLSAGSAAPPRARSRTPWRACRTCSVSSASVPVSQNVGKSQCQLRNVDQEHFVLQWWYEYFPGISRCSKRRRSMSARETLTSQPASQPASQRWYGREGKCQH